MTRWALSYTLVLLSLSTRATAYIPATPSNNTSILPDPANADSTILLRWADEGYYQEGISRQLQMDQGSTGIEKGALVHFYENASHPSWDGYTSTPWVALINCESNSTDASQEDDIFTIVRDRGAVASLLFSTWSESCILNPEYLNPAEFQKVLDIYTTLTRSSARLIESQFTNVNETEYYFFNPTRLNDSVAAIESAINGSHVTNGYLIATVKLANVTDPDPGIGNSSSGGTPQSAPAGGGGTSTGLAMIILYAITGCVSALFCVVIITGAVRALRHPERYGPRMGDPTMDGHEGAPQTRAAGLTRAILDTFPVVKFGRGNNPSQPLPPVPTATYGKYPESGVESARATPVHRRRSDQGAEELELINSPHDGTDSIREQRSMEGEGEISPSGMMHPRAASSNAQSDSAGGPSDRPTSPKLDPTPDMIGTEICPICITEFEEGDDLRVLPCEGKHKFHRDCVDPWLLQVSSVCPLCREDFITLENMATGVAPEDDAPQTQGPQPIPQPSALRFSRYLRNAQRRRHQNQPTLHESAAASRDLLP